MCRLGPALLAATVIAAMAAGPAAARTRVGPTSATPPENLELIIDTAALAVDDGLARLGSAAQEADGTQVALPSAVRLEARGRHTANWVVEHVLVEELLSRGLSVVAASATVPTLAFRILELKLQARSGIMGSHLTRRCRVALSMQLERNGELVWSGDARGVLSDRVLKRQMVALQSSTYAFGKVEVEEQSWGKYVEPVIVSSVLGSLAYLFFSNR